MKHGSPLIYGGVANALMRSHQGVAVQSSRKPENTEQWICYKCFINNYNGRASCFKCGTLRANAESFALDAKGLSMVGALPCDTLLLRELPTSATAVSIRHAVVHYTGIGPLRVRLAASRMFAFIEMASLADAEVAHQKLQRMCLYIDNCAVFVSFSRYSLDAVLSDGHIKLLEEQQDNVGTSQNSPNSSTVGTPFGILPVFPVPDPAQLQFESSSGYYYDKTTGFYYDPNTEFYYSPKSRTWKFWCQKYRTYIDCEGGNTPLKRRLQEDERRTRQTEAEANAYSGPPSMAEHRNALRDAPPPPNRSGNNNHSKTATVAGVVPSSKTRTDADNARRPLLLELEEDDNGQTVFVEHEQRGEEGGRKMVRTDERNGGQQRKQHQAAATRKMVETQHQIVVDDVQWHDKEILMFDDCAAKVVPPPLSQQPLSSSAAANNNNNNNGNSSNASLMQTLHESMRLNQIVIRQLSAQRSSAKERQQIGNLQTQIDALLAQQQALSASIEQLGGCSSESASSRRKSDDGAAEHRRHHEHDRHHGTPQLKRHITREHPHEMDRRRSPSIVDLAENGEDNVVPSSATAHHSSVANRQAHSPSPQRQSSSSSWRNPLVTREDLGQLVTALVKRGIDEEWRNLRKRRRSRSRSPSRSPPPHGRRDERWRDKRENDRRSRRHDERRSRSRDRSRDRQRHRQMAGQEPMTIEDSPSPPPAAQMHNQFWQSPHGAEAGNEGGGGVVHNVPPMFPALPVRHGFPPFSADPPADARFMMANHAVGFMPSPMPAPNVMLQNLIRHNISQQPFINNAPPLFMPRGPLPPVRMSATPGVPPDYMPRSPNVNQFFINNNNNTPLHEQQLRYPAALSSAAAARVMTPSAFAAASSPFARRGAATPVAVNQLDIVGQQQKKSQLLSKERDKVNNLGICLNCGRPGHSLFQCRWNRISDDELQKKLREAKQKQQRQELDKQGLKRKAEKYPLRRKDPLVERLRVVAPHGKITMEHIRMLCPKCAHFNHTRMECSRPEIGRPLHKQIFTQLEEFKKVFFVHLQEDNMVDLSQKFDTFRVMDGIERNGTIDPVGLQLQAMCPDGIVTQMDLRELCSNCAQLGHKKSECPEKTECSRTHFEKMLDMVKAYRALVKEGKGNCVLPTAKMMNPPVLVLKDIERSEPIEEILLLDSSDEEDTTDGKENAVEVQQKEETHREEREQEEKEEEREQKETETPTEVEKEKQKEKENDGKESEKKEEGEKEILLLDSDDEEGTEGKEKAVEMEKETYREREEKRQDERKEEGEQKEKETPAEVEKEKQKEQENERESDKKEEEDKEIVLLDSGDEEGTEGKEKAVEMETYREEKKEDEREQKETETPTEVEKENQKEQDNAEKLEDKEAGGTEEEEKESDEGEKEKETKEKEAEEEEKPMEAEKEAEENEKPMEAEKEKPMEAEENEKPMEEEKEKPMEAGENEKPMEAEENEKPMEKEKPMEAGEKQVEEAPKESDITI